MTGILASGGNTTNTTTPVTYAWNAAVQTCNSSTYGGYAAGSWRLPTQKELMSLYEHGIVSLAGASFMTLANMRNYYWSSSTASSSTTNAWSVYLANGYTTNHRQDQQQLRGLCKVSEPSGGGPGRRLSPRKSGDSSAWRGRVPCKVGSPRLHKVLDRDPSSQMMDTVLIYF